MKIRRLILHLLLALTACQPVAPQLVAGPLQARAGLSPVTGLPSGWYISEVTLHILAPADALADGKPIRDGKLTISGEGRHLIELQPGPFGGANRVTQSVDIDRTAPRVAWLTEPDALAAAESGIRAEISDATSGICRIEHSFDSGRTWQGQIVPALRETTWSLHRDFSGRQLALLRAYDCAGNVSQGEMRVFRGGRR